MLRILAAFVTLLGLAGWISYFLRPRIQPTFAWYRLNCPKIANVHVDEESHPAGQAVFKAHTDSLKIRAVARELSEDEAARHFKGMEASLLSYYVPRASPYIGMLTRVSDCPEKFQPQKLSSNQGALQEGFVMYSTSRFTAGACGEDQAAYAMLQFIIYCPNRSYEVTTFDSEKNFERLKDIFQTCGCR